MGETKGEKLSCADFDTIAIIGRGGFGEVRLVRRKSSGKLYAMKVMAKKIMRKKNQLNHLLAERDLLAKTRENAHVVHIHSSFQDNNSLYLVMEYLAGGDLMEMLMKRGNFSESETRFYMAEILLAVQCIHESGYVHRDLKPDNILLDKEGHIRLTDFGLCAEYQKRVSQIFDPKNPLTMPVFTVDELKEVDSIESEGTLSPRACAVPACAATAVADTRLKLTVPGASKKYPERRLRSVVGTPEYMGPEVLNGKKESYGPECDFWAMGVICFELLYGYRPFWARTARAMVSQINNFEEYLQLPEEPEISDNARSLINGLLARRDQRLTFEEMKLHPFFDGVDWLSIKNQPACIKPKIENELDVSNFPELAPMSPVVDSKSPEATAAAFPGYTFRAPNSPVAVIADNFFDDPSPME